MQGVVAQYFLILGVVLVTKMNLNMPEGIGMVIGFHTLSNGLASAFLLAISALAVKAGIMASSLAFSGVIVLTLANTVVSFGGLVIGKNVMKALKKQGWVEA